MFTVALFFLLGSVSVEAQYRIRIVLQSIPVDHAYDTVFIAGNFNRWQPNITAFKIINKEWVVELDSVPKGNVQFKCTRGSWDKVESTLQGKDIDNHVLYVQSDTVMYIQIEGWKDLFTTAASSRVSTASAQVIIMDTAFYMPQLKRKRAIRLYLPEGYAHSKKSYPVLYVQDGQNAFDVLTAPYGEWGIDECLDSLVEKGKAPCIVVAIDNSVHRLKEYNPFNHKRYGLGEGDAYVDFLVHQLKPYIDKHYRTQKDASNTAIAGSSMGALIAYYATLKYPTVFGKGGFFSPAFWIAKDTLSAVTASLAPMAKGKYYFYKGLQEDADDVVEMQRIIDQFAQLTPGMVFSVSDEAGAHNEKSWRNAFAEFYLWLMADGFNEVIKLKAD
jgi:metallo-beta-lactamase class B